MSGKRLTAKSWGLAALTLIVLSGCVKSQTGAGAARLDAMQPYIGPCAGALAGDSMPAAREACTPLVVIADG